MVAVDDGGLVSEKSFSVPIRYIAPKSKKTIEKLTIGYDRSHGNIVLHRDFAQPDEYHFVIDSSVNGEGLMQFHAVDNKTRQYADQLVSSGNTYDYAIKVFNENGSSSQMSQMVSLKIEK